MSVIIERLLRTEKTNEPEMNVVTVENTFLVQIHNIHHSPIISFKEASPRGSQSRLHHAAIFGQSRQSRLHAIIFVQSRHHAVHVDHAIKS